MNKPMNTPQSVSLLSHISFSESKTKSTFSSDVGVLFPSSMPESELEVLVEASLSDSILTSLASLSPSSSGCFWGRLCRGRGTGTTMTEPGCSSVGVSGSASFLGKGIGVVGEGVVGLGVSGGGSPSKLVWLVWHGSFPGDLGDGEVLLFTHVDMWPHCCFFTLCWWVTELTSVQWEQITVSIAPWWLSW